MPDPHPIDVIVQGSQDAEVVVIGLSRSFSTPEFRRIVHYLAKHGPRGPRLHDRYADQANCDALVLGRDLLSQAGELEGWDGGF